MPLGFAPLANGGVGDAPYLKAEASSTSGAFVQLTGFSATATLGTATAKINAGVTLTGLSATFGFSSAVSVTTGSGAVSVNVQLPAMTAGLGTPTANAKLVVQLPSLVVSALLLPHSYAGVSSTTASGLQGAGELGIVAVNVVQDWVDIVPVYNPGWIDIVTSV